QPRRLPAQDEGAEDLAHPPGAEAGRGRRVPANAGAAGSVQAAEHVHQLHALLRGVSGLRPGAEVPGPAGIRPAPPDNPDSPDGAAQERMDHIASSEGVWECTFVGECTKVCPKNVDPAGAIQQVKVQATKDWWLGWLLPKGAGK